MIQGRADGVARGLVLCLVRPGKVGAALGAESNLVARLAYRAVALRSGLWDRPRRAMSANCDGAGPGPVRRGASMLAVALYNVPVRLARALGLPAIRGAMRPEIYLPEKPHFFGRMACRMSVEAAGA